MTPIFSAAVPTTAASAIDAALQSLADFPSVLRTHFAAIPATFAHWAPPAWDGIPSERFTPIEQLLHVRDIEQMGYHVRLRRTLEEERPQLADIDSYELAAHRGYALADVNDADDALEDFAQARAQTVDMLRQLPPEAFARPAVFEGVGPVTLRGLVHYLCSHDQQHLAGLHWLMARIDAEQDALQACARKIEVIQSTRMPV